MVREKRRVYSSDKVTLMPERKKPMGPTKEQIAEMAEQKRTASFVKPRRVIPKVGQSRMLARISSSKFRNNGMITPMTTILSNARAIRKRVQSRKTHIGKAVADFDKLTQRFANYSEYLHKSVGKMRNPKNEKISSKLLEKCDAILAKGFRQIDVLKKNVCEEAREEEEKNEASGSAIEANLEKVADSLVENQNKHDSAVGSFMDIQFEANSARGGQPSDLPIIAHRGNATDARGVTSFSPFVRDPYITIDDTKTRSRKRHR